MRHASFAAFLVVALGVAAPVGAQIAGRHDYGPVGGGDPFIGDSSFGYPGGGREARDIRGRIRDGVASGQLSRSEARELRRDTRRLGRAARIYRRDGLSASEARALSAWALALRGRISAARLRSDSGRR